MSDAPPMQALAYYNSSEDYDRFNYLVMLSKSHPLQLEYQGGPLLIGPRC